MSECERFEAAGTPAKLIAMCGLPGAGKSAFAEDLAQGLPAMLLSVDPIEAGLWRAGIEKDQPTGLAAYVVAEVLAAEALTLGQTVVIDAVNDAAPARQQWKTLAEQKGLPLHFIEVRCSDEGLHRRRLETRRRNIPGFTEPEWSAALARRRGFEGWNDERLVIDSVHPREHNLRLALRYLTGSVAGQVDCAPTKLQPA